MVQTAPRAGRRSTEEVRKLIIDAASEQFTSRGYAGTTTRSVASAAGISLSVLHHHFPSKEALLSAALLSPFLSSFDEFASAWSGQVESPWDAEVLVREFVRDLYRNLAGHRRTMVTLLAVGEASQTELLENVRQSLATGLTDLATMAEYEATTRGWFPPETVPYTNALVIAMVTGLVLIQPWLPEPMCDDEETMIDVAARLAAYGFRLAPPNGSGPPVEPRKARRNRRRTAEPSS